MLPVPYRTRRHRCIDCGTRWNTIELRAADLKRMLAQQQPAVDDDVA